MKILTVPSSSEAAIHLGKCLEKQSDAVLGENGRNVFRIGISGGSLLDLLADALLLVKTEFSKWQFFLCDERYVPDDHDDSNYNAFYQKVITKVPGLKEAKGFKANTKLDLKACAADYEKRILTEFGISGKEIPKFDVLLLGMGPDGHTCSLFPGDAALLIKDKFIAAIDNSPKPPPKRITMTYPLINNASSCMFVLTGAAKADMVKRVFVEKDTTLPAALVAPEIVSLILDDAAAKYVCDM